MRIPIVNEQDEVIGYKERDECGPDDIMRVSLIWITDENENILLQQRKLTKKKNPGKWGPAVAGGVEEGETYESNAYKEMEEEIGLKDVLIYESNKFYGKTNVGKRFCQLYTAQIQRSTQLIPKEDEVEQLKWFSKQELGQYIKDKPDDFVGLMQDLKVFYNI
ncbi:hypothetical protein A2733_00135 [Candidatus Nomurabacteria bacterium RIFCSPHIGHO2_01_FULL_40_20]|uniref:Nudix hydrolase domain-containing protein n=1 Tax=Candidatus Nomurabacteria bacterium RIFCSPHIGHO2_01_FULL_40_20 TaxID=1801738 RepID=A0A1F6V3X1_9BACT|nr:MAG: hypothetical protein A2733_00135 [Candidatus Nomurabacteria bacterium RIFCSPHIGHO2_01_FULL_40_20]